MHTLTSTLNAQIQRGNVNIGIDCNSKCHEQVMGLFASISSGSGVKSSG